MAKILVVVADYYRSITVNMADEAAAHLRANGAEPHFCYVPGSLEIPAAISFAIIGNKENYDGYVALGCIIKGETDHYEHVSRECMRGIMDVSIQHMVPIGNGVITAPACYLARARSTRNSPNNVARHAAEAALKMTKIYKQFV